jgi:hypothetical protein
MNTIRLDNFIAQTIKEIIDGVQSAQEYAKTKGARVNPDVVWEDEQPFVLTDMHKPHASSIDFDVVLTIGDDDKAQGGIGVFAASFGLGVKGETKEYAESVNKIRFQILVQLPDQR